MKKKSTLLTALGSLFLSGFLMAQPTILNSKAPKAGGKLDLYLAMSPIDYSQTGANVTWDFSSAAISSKAGTIELLDPAATPYGTNFTAANLAIKSTVLMNNSVSYEYHVINADKWETIAENVSSTGSTTYSDYKTTFVFPFNFNDVLSDTYMETGGASVNFTRTYDSYGTFISPFGTFNNVIRVKRDENNIVWYYTDPIFPVFQKEGNNFIFFNSPPPTGISNENSNSLALSVYPNPANEVLNISIKSMITSNGRIEIYNYLNEKISEKELIQFNGEASVSINNLTQGVYYLKFITEKETFINRFLKQ